MNEEDKKRFARYKPGFISPPDEFNIEVNRGNVINVETINVKKDELLKNILENVVVPDSNNKNVKDKVMRQIKVKM